MPLLMLLTGALLGAVLGRGFDAVVAGGFIGLIAGLVFSAWRRERVPPHARGGTVAMADPLDPLGLLDPRVAERMRTMERRISTLEAALRAISPAALRASAAAGSDAVSRTARPDAAGAPVLHAPPATGFTAAPATSGAAGTSPTREDERVASDTLRRDAPVPPMPALAARGGPGSPVPPMPAYAARSGAGSSPPAQPSLIWRWITGGNTLARVGVVVLFIGVAFLLKYASENVTIPIEFRLAAVALGGVVLLALGWRLRGRRAGYAMTLQGAAIGILYLTVFASLRIYHFLTPAAAFGLLFWIAALSSYLAVRQDSMALAVLGVVGGFAAPVLTSSGDGSHVMLFSYYAVLNTAIFAIAWFKAWRVLNIVGFVCTFIVGATWGVTRYRPEDLATTEPFLVLFFLFYVAIATLYALRRSLEVRRYVDATLVFGTPLVAAGLQAALVRDIEYALAWSAIAASATYLPLARLLDRRHRDDLRLLVEAFLALGIVFATLAVPLALDARLTSATWALEGAALVWAGVRQRHLGPRVFGLLLQLGAGVAFALGFSLWTQRLVGSAMPVLNSDCVGALIVACGAFVSSRVMVRAEAITPAERSLVPFLFGWGVLWWLGAGAREIERFVAVDARIPVLVAFLAGSAAMFAAIARRLDWRMARVPALALAPALLLIALYQVLNVTRDGGHLLGAGGVFAWPFALAIGMLLVHRFERVAPAVPERLLDAGHAMLAWLVTLIAAQELAWLAQRSVSGGAWRLVPWGLVPALALMAISGLSSRTGWPVGTRVRAYVAIAGIPLAAAMLIWTLYANLQSNGDAAPLPFVPIVNPLDLAQGFVFVALAQWWRRAYRAQPVTPASVAPEALAGAVAWLLLLWVTCSTLRTLHHWADVPWLLTAMWSSRSVQAALSLVWSVFALAAMVIANRRGYRFAWVAGAVLLAVVVAKLFFVDLSQIGGVERIVSFMGVGVLLLVIGYLAPVPPRGEAS